MKHAGEGPGLARDPRESVRDGTDKNARAWTVTRGQGGEFQEELSLERLMSLNPDHSAEQILAAAMAHIDSTRSW